MKEEHGRPGEEGYVPWCRDGDYVKRHEDADFPVYLGGWDQDPNYAEYHGYDERSIDPRFYGGRSRLAYSAETGEPWFGVRMKTMTRVCRKLLEYMDPQATDDAVISNQRSRIDTLMHPR